MKRYKKTSLIPVSVTIDGDTYKGAYFVHHFTVCVLSPLGEKAREVGASPPETIAQQLFSELVNERTKRKAAQKSIGSRVPQRRKDRT